MSEWSFFIIKKEEKIFDIQSKFRYNQKIGLKIIFHILENEKWYFFSFIIYCDIISG